MHAHSYAPRGLCHSSSRICSFLIVFCCVDIVTVARDSNIQIVCVVDTDKQPARSVVDGYMEKGMRWLFDEQTLSYSTQGREHFYKLLTAAISRAVAQCAAGPPTLAPAPTGTGAGVAGEKAAKQLEPTKQNAVHDEQEPGGADDKASPGVQ